MPSRVFQTKISIERDWSIYGSLKGEHLAQNVFVKEFIETRFDPFHANVPILYPLKTPNVWFSGDFRGYNMEILAGNRLTY